MSMFTAIKNRFSELTSRLTHVGQKEPLSKLSIVVIIFLDIFVLTTIISGLDDSASQLTSPENYIPYDCQSFVISADIKLDSEKLDLVAERVNTSAPYYPVEKVMEYEQALVNQKSHPICAQVQKRISDVKASATIQELFQNRSDLLGKKSSIQSQIDEVKKNYDTVLLEKIANLEQEALKMQQERNKLTADLNRVDLEIEVLETQISATTEYKAVWSYVLDNSALNQKTLEKELEVANFWFPVKRLGMDFAFLLPLLFVIYFWNSRSIKKDNGVQMLLSSHLLVVVAIPTLWKIIDLVLQIIPDKLLEMVMLWLSAMKLLAIWYYLLVIVAIFVALGIIYLIQKKFFNKKRLIEKRLSKGECIECGENLPKDCIYCPFCATSQLRICESCKKETYVGGEFCKNCGASK